MLRTSHAPTFRIPPSIHSQASHYSSDWNRSDFDFDYSKSVDQLIFDLNYAVKFKHATLQYRTKCPDYSNLPTARYDWNMTPYGNVPEEIPDDCPTPLGNPVITTTWVDANLYHDFMTGRSVTGIIHSILAYACAN